MGSIDEVRIPQRGDLAQKFREGVSKREDLGELSRGQEEATVPEGLQGGIGVTQVKETNGLNCCVLRPMSGEPIASKGIQVVRVFASAVVCRNRCWKFFEGAFWRRFTIVGVGT